MPFEDPGVSCQFGRSTLQPVSYLLEPQLRCNAYQDHEKRTTTFVNRRAVCVILYALDASGRRVQHATIAPGQRSEQRTAPSEPWIAVERGSAGTAFQDTPLSIWLAGETDGVAYID